MVLEERPEQLLPTNIKIFQYFGNHQGSICATQPLDLDTPMKETQGLVLQEFPCGELKVQAGGKHQLPANETSAIKELHAEHDRSPGKEALDCLGRGMCFG